MKKRSQYFEGGPVSLIEFDKENPNISLDLPEDPVMGWNINHFNTDEVCLATHNFSRCSVCIHVPCYASTQNDFVASLPNITLIQVSVNWAGTAEQLQKLEHELVLVCGKSKYKLKISSPERSSSKIALYY